MGHVDVKVLCAQAAYLRVDAWIASDGGGGSASTVGSRRAFGRRVSGREAGLPESVEPVLVPRPGDGGGVSGRSATFVRLG